MAKQILITGASSGIGEATARHLASEGNELVLVARNKEKLEQLSEELPTKSLVIPFDLTHLEEIEEIFKTCKNQGIQLDGMVHSAGKGINVPVRNNDIQTMKDIMTLNYYSFVELGKYFYRRKYSSDGSSIVVLSSLSVKTCYPGVMNYSASKASVNVAVQTMSKEFVKRRIRVNAVMPALVGTPAIFNDYNMADPDVDQPLGMIDAKYVAYVIGFLLSEKAAYITGAEIPISAGMTYRQ